MEYFSSPTQIFADFSHKPIFVCCKNKAITFLKIFTLIVRMALYSLLKSKQRDNTFFNSTKKEYEEKTNKKSKMGSVGQLYLSLENNKVIISL